MSRIHSVVQAGQSIWMDYIRRSFLESGEFERWIGLGVTGITSNPTILEQAISNSTDYDAALAELATSDASVVEAYESLVIADIQAAADRLRATYDLTGGKDGYVSLEVDPHLATDADATVREARRLFEQIARPNAMIKVPATSAGCRALEELLSRGINVNVTLIFSVSQYAQVLESFQRGLEARIDSGGSVSTVASVASFFVSRIDSAVDPELETLRATELLGQTAIASAALAYDVFSGLLASHRWKALAKAGASPQRLLWASTSTKNPNYPDTVYVDSLIAPETVNTVPLDTLQAVLDHGRADCTRLPNADDSRHILTRLDQLGIDLTSVTDQLLAEGLDKFTASFDALIERLDEQLNRHREHQRAPVGLEIHLPGKEEELAATRRDLREGDVIRRIWNHDYTLWSPSPNEIDNRLSWLHTPATIGDHLDDMRQFVRAAKADGLRQAILLGMGGSSLAPEVFVKTFGAQPDGIPLQVIDTTHPDSVSAAIETLEPKTTLFVVASKSGTTIETQALFRVFYNRVRRVLSFSESGRRFAAITDPGSSLVELGEQLAFRRIFHNDPNLGGRYSALSHFGLVPASILGVDIEPLLRRSQAMSAACAVDNLAVDNPGARLGAALAAAASRGRDKLTLLPSDGLRGFDDWMEQLIAESTGKGGTGIIPIVGEPTWPAPDYRQDRLFVSIEAETEGGSTADARCRELLEAGHPVIRVWIKDHLDLGGLFVLWEFATAVAAHLLGIHPFNQPDVEASKRRMRELVDTTRKPGRVPWLRQDADDDTTSLTQFETFVQSIPADGYAAIQAYLPSPPDGETIVLLAKLRATVARRTGCATTLGYGPRFLHSTGQLHKGGPGSGRFLQLLSTSAVDLAIPDEPGTDKASLTFGTLLAAQAMGDRQALEDAGRAVVSIALGDRPLEALRRLLTEL